MTVTEWEPLRRLGVRHTGVVTGEGSFAIEVHDDKSTELVWEEQLHLPKRFGGKLGAHLAKPVFEMVWRGNLKRFKHLVEG